MATKFNLKVSTPVGEFTRKATKPYSHVVVRVSPRAKEFVETYAARGRKPSGVDARWVKDRGYATTWHNTEAAARKAAAAPYVWDGSVEVVGVFAVEAA
jgi:hypothetical protein